MVNLVVFDKFSILLMSPSVVIYDGRCLACEMLTVAGAARDLLSLKQFTLFPFLPHVEVNPSKISVKTMRSESQRVLASSIKKVIFLNSPFTVETIIFIIQVCN